MLSGGPGLGTMCVRALILPRDTHPPGTPPLRLKHGSPEAMVNGELVHSRARGDTRGRDTRRAHVADFAVVQR